MPSGFHPKSNRVKTSLLGKIKYLNPPPADHKNLSKFKSGATDPKPANKAPPTLNKVSFFGQCQMISHEIFVRKAVAIQKQNIFLRALINCPIQNFRLPEAFVFVPIILGRRGKLL